MPHHEPKIVETASVFMQRVKLLRRLASTAQAKPKPKPQVKEYALLAQGRHCLAHSTFAATGKELVTDTPRRAGGTDKGAQPVEHLLAAL